MCRGKRNFLLSPQFRGTFYELAAIDVLSSHLGFTGLVRVGGSGDNGLDLVGTWDLSRFLEVAEGTKLPRGSLLLLAQKTPSFDFRHHVNVLVQCKNSLSKIKATIVRELAGIREYHTNMKSALEVSTNFMVLVSSLPLTLQAQVQMQMSNVPMLHTRMIPSEKTIENGENDYDLSNWKSASLQSVYINPPALRLLKGLGVESFLQTINKTL